MALGALIQAGSVLIPGIAKGIGSLFGGRKRRQRERAGMSEYQRQLSAYKGFEFTNPYAGLENRMEDLRVATGAAEFESQQQERALAQGLEALRGTAGGTGVAAIAQALAQQQARGQQQISARLEEQELRNQLISAQAQQQLDLQMARGEDLVQQREFERQSTLLGMSQQELAAAREARAAATSALTEGLGTLAGGFLGYKALGGSEGIKNLINSNG